uniref:Prepilin-type N-terminal cleavage/methylation domain-containing protein n=1 Tax=Pseudomonas fluorescens (strain SBW25) TaxID=216595 RepID=A0A0G4E463_PSEFS|nr:prepilin-type N-terminal cleavage/methylation domain-containing protein [Pseudomonas fluorescens]CEK42036.1 hypothetical protein PQBR57_0083 [Pseudomonas fluorescens SBW25]
MNNPAAGKQRGFTLIELMVVLAVLGIIAAYTTPKYIEELNLRRANLTAEDTTQIMDAARSYRVATASWPGGASSCSNAIALLKADGYLSGLITTNRYNNAVTTSCDTKTFSVIQSAVEDWDGYLTNSIAGTEITNAGSYQITSKIGIPGSEPALNNKLTRVATGNIEDNRMRTTLYMGGQQMAEAGDINFSQANPTLNAQSGSLTLSAQNGQIIIPAGQTLTVDDVIVRSRGNRPVSSGMPNFVQIGSYIVRDGWLVTKPTCPSGGIPKAALRPAAMRGGYSGSYDPNFVGRYGINYRLTSSGAYWIVTAVAEGYAADYQDLDSLVDVYCYYSN